jgi:signal recognition particle receptor subunit beta
MVFFNYSTMQMAAKVVYYGPGLCGKTTNLHFIYGHTSGDSRGEMVSLETETDRTLFFDLLPIDIGTIAGFNTRIQLYTVPGQVFYNTTRKLVLKGVDGVVFVADSQRTMLQANQESFHNLEENLAEMGLSLDSLPLVLQYNKRDLPSICTVEEMNQAINRNNWPHFEASALTGEGVFETLKGISKYTLLALKRRLGRPGAETPAPARPAPAPPPPVAAPAPPAPSEPAASHERYDPFPSLVQPVDAPPPPSLAPPPPLAPPVSPAAPALSVPTGPPAPAAARPPSTGRTRTVDVLGELERLRREAIKGHPQPAAQRVASAPDNGRPELSRSIELSLAKADWKRARSILVSIQVEDDESRVVDSSRSLRVDLKDVASLEKLLLRLNVALSSQE